MVLSRLVYLSALSLLGLGVTFHTSTAQAEGIAIERAEGERLATAVGHYARARSLLIAAVHEFDRGQEYANPDTLLDSSRFRSSLINRAEELERILDPQPRASKSGVKFSADSRLLGEAKK